MPIFTWSLVVKSVQINIFFKRWWGRIVNHKTKENLKKMICLYILYMSIYRTPSQATIWNIASLLFTISAWSDHPWEGSSIMGESRELPEIYQSLFNMTFWWPLTMMNTSYFQKKKTSSLLASVALFSLASPHTFLSNPSKSALLSFHSPKIHWYNICCIPK